MSPVSIEAGQDPTDIVSVTDWFTTAARLGRAKELIPDDRVTDGVDQTCLLAQGEGQSHRDYMFYYSGEQLGAVRTRQVKHTIGLAHGGIVGGGFFDVVNNPQEKQEGTGVVALPYMSLGVPFKDIIAEHNKMIERFPHRVLPPSSSPSKDQRAMEA